MSFSRSLVVILSIIVLALIGYLSFKETKDYIINTVVKDGQVKIDQQFHEWNICNDKLPKFQIFVRNNSDLKVFGNLKFLVLISNKGLEKNFMDEVINCAGTDFIKNDYLNRKRMGVDIGRLRPLINYIERGSKLQNSYDYEPYDERKTEKEYNFKFQQCVSLKPGGILKIETEKQIPVNIRGGVTKIIIEDITF
ncbi:MAG: hypothetical protein ABSB79_14775 [Syntrophales bacterium]|jgi:uncharacterized protein YxeA